MSGESLVRLACDARSAVDSHLELTVIIGRADSPVTLTALDDTAEGSESRASLLLTMPDTRSEHAIADAVVPVSLILFAGKPGAYVDLAADLSWIAGRELAAIVLDQHLPVPTGPAATDTFGTESVINQAIGVLISRGNTPQQARHALTTRAGNTTDRRHAAVLVLGTIPAADAAGPGFDRP